MNRRDFLKRTLGLAAVAAVPLPAPKVEAFEAHAAFYMRGEVVPQVQVPLRHAWGRITISAEMLKQPARGAWKRALTFDREQAERVMNELVPVLHDPDAPRGTWFVT